MTTARWVFQDPGACALAATGNGGLAAPSDRGAIRIESAVSASAVAYEALSAAKDAWQCGIVLVTAPDASSSRAREVLTELPPDADAIRGSEKSGRPLGGDRFIAGLEKNLNRSLKKSKPGPKRPPNN